MAPRRPCLLPLLAGLGLLLRSGRLPDAFGLAPARKGSDPLLEVLKGTFALEAFRAGQREVCEAVVAGEDALVVLPTGGGKSLCYQLPALVRRMDRGGGVTLVASPLIALMKDQVDALTEKGVAVTVLNSKVRLRELRARMAALERGEYAVAYVAPERFDNEEFLNVTQRLVAKGMVNLLAIDEAHCVSAWGHDFRRAYRRLAAVRAMLQDGEEPVPTVALTATATPRVRADILEVLEMEGARQFVRGFDRPNIRLEVRQCASNGLKLQAIDEILATSELPALIYAGSHRAVESVAKYLAGTHRVASYHAGYSGRERDKEQDDFLTGRSDVMVATNAFGMGIDKSDIRTVVHYEMPGSIEAFYQEVGRAGRDGAPSRAVLLVGSNDAWLQEFLINQRCPKIKAVRKVYKELLRMSKEEGRIFYFTLEAFAAALAPQDRGLVGGATGVGSCLRALSRAGVIRRIHRDERTLRARFRGGGPAMPKNAPNQLPVYKMMEQRKDITVAPKELVALLGIDRMRLLTAFKNLERKGLITYEAPETLGGAEMLQLDKDESTLLGRQLEMELVERRKDEMEKLHQMAAYSKDNIEGDCRKKFILQHFGDDRAEGCGNCDLCLKRAGNWTPPQTASRRAPLLKAARAARAPLLKAAMKQVKGAPAQQRGLPTMPEANLVEAARRALSRLSAGGSGQAASGSAAAKPGQSGLRQGKTFGKRAPAVGSGLAAAKPGQSGLRQGKTFDKRVPAAGSGQAASGSAAAKPGQSALRPGKNFGKRALAGGSRQVASGSAAKRPSQPVGERAPLLLGRWEK